MMEVFIVSVVWNKGVRFHRVSLEFKVVQFDDAHLLMLRLFKILKLKPESRKAKKKNKRN